MPEVTIEDKTVGWLVNFGIIMPYILWLYPKTRGFVDRTGKKIPSPIENDYSRMINALNSALAIQGYSPRGQTVLARPTTLAQFLPDYYTLRSQLPGLLSFRVANPDGILLLVDNFFTRWIAPKISRT